MSALSQAHAATELLWLTPSASSLVLLARPVADAWTTLRLDPGAVLLLLRTPSTDTPLPFPASLLASAGPLESAVALLARGVAGSAFASAAVLRGAVTSAFLAHHLAQRGGRVDPERAWCAGLLAPLGWFALAAAAPPAAVANLATAQRTRAIDPVGIGRCLARRWQLPGWLTGVLGLLELPLHHARLFGVDAALFATVRLAAHLAHQHHGVGLFDLQGDPLAEREAVGLSLSDLDEVASQTPPDVPGWRDPHTEPLLPDLLALALDHRRLEESASRAVLEREVNHLHLAFREQLAGEEARLRAEKLSALAEFAAGAGHEINNPLAVISGQAQYILGHEEGWFTGEDEGACRKALQTIIGQTKRVHSLLRDLMQFARPLPPRPVWFDLPTLLGEVRAGLEELATARRVRVELVACPERVAVHADRDQVQQTLSCLFRNAVEAAPADGVARLVLQDDGGERIEVRVEDSGNGPSAEQRPHLFDPFYSGRAAGRGRGLGLPVAWRLARQQGGDVQLRPGRAGEPTRFVLLLPRQTPPEDRAAA